MQPQAEPTTRACPECLAVYEDGFLVCARDGTALADFDVNPLVGHELERYRIDAVLGSGAMGRVYRAQHLRMSRQFALKLMYGNLAADRRMRLRFAREAEAASRLSHPNLITVVDVGETATGLPYLAMDLVDGAPLDLVIADEAPLPTARVVAIARGLLRGLGHAHARGLVHRDLKPANVLLTRHDGEEVPRIVDFGVALVGGSLVGRVTSPDLVLGTPEYMAPEQAHGEEDIDPRADQFALGVVLYEMLSGVLPFSGRSVDIMRKNIATAPPPFAERAPHVVVAPALEAVIMRLMAKQREDRYPGAAEVLDALDLAVPGGRHEARGPAPGDEVASAPAIPPETRAARPAAPASAAVAPRATTATTAVGRIPAPRGGATPRRRIIAAAAATIVAGLAALIAARHAGQGPGAEAARRSRPAGAAPGPAPATADALPRAAAPGQPSPGGAIPGAAAPGQPPPVDAIPGAAPAAAGAVASAGAGAAELPALTDAVPGAAELDPPALDIAADAVSGAAPGGPQVPAAGAGAAIAADRAHAAGGAGPTAPGPATHEDHARPRGPRSARPPARTAGKGAAPAPATTPAAGATASAGATAGSAALHHDAGAGPPPGTAREAPRPGPLPLAADEMVARYRRLGERLDALARSAPTAAGPLRRRYFAIPLVDALRRPELRAEIVEAIEAIERDVSRGSDE